MIGAIIRRLFFLDFAPLLPAERAYGIAICVIPDDIVKAILHKFTLMEWSAIALATVVTLAPLVPFAT